LLDTYGMLVRYSMYTVKIVLCALSVQDTLCFMHIGL